MSYQDAIFELFPNLNYNNMKTVTASIPDSVLELIKDSMNMHNPENWTIEEQIGWLICLAIKVSLDEAELQAAQEDI